MSCCDLGLLGVFHFPIGLEAPDIIHLDVLLVEILALDHLLPTGRWPLHSSFLSVWIREPERELLVGSGQHVVSRVKRQYRRLLLVFEDV